MWAVVSVLIQEWQNFTQEDRNAWSPSTYTWERCRKPVGVKMQLQGRTKRRWDKQLSSLGPGYFTSKDLGFAGLSQFHLLRNAAVTVEPHVVLRKVPPPAETFKCHLVADYGRRFVLNTYKCWSHAGLLLGVCPTCKSNQHCTGFKHLLWIKLVRADCPPAFYFYCCYSSGFWAMHAFLFVDGKCPPRYVCWNMVSAQKPPWRVR